MNDGRPEQLDERVLVLAPTARDGAASRDLLAAAGVRCLVCATIGEVCREAERGAGVAVVTAEAVLGWMTTDGPLALPARWNAERSRARVPAGPFKAAGRRRTAPACVCVDQSEGRFGPIAKRGTLVRGMGHATLRGEVATVALEADRITRWKGFDTTTRPAGIT